MAAFESMSRRMRILSLGNCPLDPLLGSGKTRLARASGLRAAGHAVESWDAPRLFGRWGRKLGHRLGLAFAARRMVARIDLARFDLVEFYGAEFWWATRWLQLRPARPMLVAYTDGLELLADERLATAGLKRPGRLERWAPFFDLGRASAQAFTRADCFVGQCQLDFDYVVQRKLLAPEHAALIYPGLDIDYLGRPLVPERQNLLVFFGSWTERKGIDHVAWVTTAFLREFPAWKLLVVGAAGQEGAVRAAFDASVADRIEVSGRQPVAAIAARLDRAKIIFAPSEYEGFGLATAEAMGCGCAAVVTPTGFAADVVPGQEALLCGFGDRMGMLASLRQLARDERGREVIARAGWQRVQGLQWPRTIRQIEQTYLAWLEAWPRLRR
jgi:glycosyltransferase involved in cell wall biosynthesis